VFLVVSSAKSGQRRKLRGDGKRGYGTDRANGEVARIAEVEVNGVWL
jgi:hypothetical protein